MTDDIKVTRKKLEDYTPNAENHNLGTERGAALIAHSFQEYGAGRSLLVDRDGVLIAGNQSIKGAAAAGITEVIEVETDGSQLVVVKRTDLDLDTDDKAVELSYVDNRAAAVSFNLDVAQIAADIERGVNLSAMWTPTELNALIDIPMPPAPAPVGAGQGDGQPQDIPQQFLVLVECTSEQHQANLLEKLTAEGYTCKAMLS